MKNEDDWSVVKKFTGRMAFLVVLVGLYSLVSGNAAEWGIAHNLGLMLAMMLFGLWGL